MIKVFVKNINSTQEKSLLYDIARLLVKSKEFGREAELVSTRAKKKINMVDGEPHAKDID